MTRRALAAALAAAFVSGAALGQLPGARVFAQSPDAAAALLALEEAELRERMITALAIAEGLRLRGRTVLVAILEINRVRRSLRDIPPTDPQRAALEARIETLERRREEVGQLLDVEFGAYVDIVRELATGLWPRLRRVGEELETELAERRLSRLAELTPVLRAHVEEMSRGDGADAEATARWRAEVDDSLSMRRDALDPLRKPEPPVAEPDDRNDQDI